MSINLRIYLEICLHIWPWICLTIGSRSRSKIRLKICFGMGLIIYLRMCSFGYQFENLFGDLFAYHVDDVFDNLLEDFSDDLFEELFWGWV